MRLHQNRRHPLPHLNLLMSLLMVWLTRCQQPVSIVCMLRGQSSTWENDIWMMIQSLTKSRLRPDCQISLNFSQKLHRWTSTNETASSCYALKLRTHKSTVTTFKSFLLSSLMSNISSRDLRPRSRSLKCQKRLLTIICIADCGSWQESLTKASK